MLQFDLLERGNTINSKRKSSKLSALFALYEIFLEVLDPRRNAGVAVSSIKKDKRRALLNNPPSQRKWHPHSTISVSSDQKFVNHKSLVRTSVSNVLTKSEDK